MPETAAPPPALTPGPAPPTARPRRNAVYPIGFFGIMFFTTLFTQWIVYFHAPPGRDPSAPAGAAGAPPALAAILLAGWVIQGILNPIVGAASDRLRPRSGGKRVLVLLGALPLAGAFFALWIPWDAPVAPLRILIYAAIVPFVVQPYISLLPAIATSAEERLRLTLAGAVLGLGAAGAALVGGAGILEVASFPGLGAAGAAAIAATIFLPALVIREPATPVREMPARGTGTLAATVRLLGHGGLAAFLAGNFLLVLAVTTLTMVGPFVTEAVLGRGRDYNVVVNAFLFAGMLLSIPLLGRLAKRSSHLRVMQAGAAAGAALAAAGLLGARLSLPLWWALFFGLGFPTLAAIAVPPLILSRMADREERGADGLIFGLNGLGVNFGCAAAAVLMTALTRLGSGPDDPDGVLAALGAAAGVLAAAAALLGRAARAEAEAAATPP